LGTPTTATREPLTADESQKAAFNDTSAGEGPDFADSSRFRSAPFQRRPVNRSTGPRFHSTPFHRLKSSKTGSPGAVSAKVLAKSPQPAGRASVPCRNFRPHDAPQFSPTSGRSAQAAGLTPAHHPPGDGPRLTRPPEVRTARPRVPTRLGSFRCASLWANRLCRAQTPVAPQAQKPCEDRPGMAHELQNRVTGDYFVLEHGDGKGTLIK
jgi:hypothetical protein